MAAAGGRPNFYLILGLDPGAPWDPEGFARALSEKRNLWSRQRNGIKTAGQTVAAQRNLALIRDIEAVMGDPEERKAEQAAALREAADGLRAEQAELKARLDLMLENGFLYDVEYDDLRKYGRVLAADPVLRQRLEDAERRPRWQYAQDAGEQRLDDATGRNLRANLKVVGEPDLYAVLRAIDPAITPAAGQEQLLRAAEGLYQEARRKADKNRPEVGAMQVLAGIGRQVFGAADLRLRHDASVRSWPLDDLLEQYERHLAPARAISAPQAERFLREAAEKGMDLTLARSSLTAYFRKRDWSVEVPAAAAEQRLRAMRRCLYCSRLNDDASAYCENCGRALREQCPGCGEQLTAGVPACSGCGFPVGERAYAEYLLDQARVALLQGDISVSAAHVAEAEKAWPVPPGRSDEISGRARAVREDLAALTAAIQAERERLAALRAELQRTQDQVAGLMRSRDYHAALRQLSGLPLGTEERARARTQCEDAIREAERLCREARMPGTPAERKAALYYEALQRCADHGDARQELARVPPAPPRRLHASGDAERGIVSLTWDAAPDPGCASVVYRVTGTRPPASPVAWQRMQVVQGLSTWTDMAPLVGQPALYAVYTEREAGGTLSEGAAVAPGPVLLAAEAQCAAAPGDGQVEVTWTLPETAAGVEVLRADAGTGAEAPLRVTGDAAGRHVDRDVVNGTRYRYTVIAVYGYTAADGTRAERRSRGVACEAVPAARPALPGPVLVRGFPPPPDLPMYWHKVELRWPPHDTGVVKVVRTSPGEGYIGAGDEFPEADLGRKGRVLTEPGDIWFNKSLFLCTYTPVLVRGGRCYAGECRRYAMGPAVTGVRVQPSGDATRVTWAWPDAADAVIVAWDAGREPFDPLAAPFRARVARLRGEATGRHDIKGAPAGLVVKVAAVTLFDGAEYVTSGAIASAEGGGDVTVLRPARGQRAKGRPGRNRPP
jgi:hypothetical protein